MKEVNKDNMWLINRCLVETLAILGNKDLIDVEKTVAFIENGDLQGMQSYLEAIRLKGGKGDD